jgi:hypothetical protein
MRRPLSNGPHKSRTCPRKCRDIPPGGRREGAIELCKRALVESDSFHLILTHFIEWPSRQGRLETMPAHFCNARLPLTRLILSHRVDCGQRCLAAPIQEQV